MSLMMSRFDVYEILSLKVNKINFYITAHIVIKQLSKSFLVNMLYLYLNHYFEHIVFYFFGL